MKKVIILLTVFMLTFSGSPGEHKPMPEREVIQKVNDLNRSVERLEKVWDEKGM